MTIRFTTYDPAFVSRVRHGGPDAYDQPAEAAVSNGQGTPCRCCLHDVPAGADMLILAACPFPALQPYAETGPIFLCADDCAAWQGVGLPPILTTSPDYLLKAYDTGHRIIYGTGQITPKADVAANSARLLADPKVAFVDVRSARNNCFQTRIVRTESE